MIRAVPSHRWDGMFGISHPPKPLYRPLLEALPREESVNPSALSRRSLPLPAPRPRGTKRLNAGGPRDSPQSPSTGPLRRGRPGRFPGREGLGPSLPGQGRIPAGKSGSRCQPSEFLPPLPPYPRFMALPGCERGGEGWGDARQRRASLAVYSGCRPHTRRREAIGFPRSDGFANRLLAHCGVRRSEALWGMESHAQEISTNSPAAADGLVEGAKQLQRDYPRRSSGCGGRRGKRDGRGERSSGEEEKMGALQRVGEGRGPASAAFGPAAASGAATFPGRVATSRKPFFFFFFSFFPFVFSGVVLTKQTT